MASISTYYCPLECTEPSEKAFDFPATAITPQGSAILSRFSFSVSPMWRNQFNPLVSKGVIERLTVIGTTPNNSSGLSQGDNFIESSLDKGDFTRASRIRMYGEWKARSVCNNHETRTFVPLSLSHFCALFFATANVASIKHSKRLMAPRSSRSRASVSRIFRNTPDLTLADSDDNRLTKVEIALASQPRLRQCAISTSNHSVQLGHHGREVALGWRKARLTGEVPKLSIAHQLILCICP